MISETTEDFWDFYAQLPRQIQILASRSYALWRRDPSHPGLRFKPVKKGPPAVWSARVGLHYRVLGLRETIDGKDTITWGWIGPHTEYDKILDGM